jgi:hypothetical protein
LAESFGPEIKNGVAPTSVFDEYDLEGCSVEQQDERDGAMARKHEQGASTS